MQQSKDDKTIRIGDFGDAVTPLVNLIKKDGTLKKSSLSESSIKNFTLFEYIKNISIILKLLNHGQNDPTFILVNGIFLLLKYLEIIRDDKDLLKFISKFIARIFKFIAYSDYSFPDVFNKFNEILSEESKHLEKSKSISNLEVNKFIEKSGIFFNQIIDGLKKTKLKERKCSYGVIIYFYFFYGSKIAESDLKDKIEDENYIANLDKFIEIFNNDELNINEIKINNSNLLLSKEKMEEMKNNLMDKDKKSSSNVDSQNSEAGTDFTATQSNTKIIRTVAGEVKEEEGSQKEELKFFEDNRLIIEYIQKKMDEMDKKYMKNLQDIKDSHSKEMKETREAHSKEMKEQEKKIEIITDEINKLNREIIDIKVWRLSNNILMSLFSNRDTIKICASTVCNFVNNDNLSNTLDWKTILEFKQNKKNLEQNIIYGIEVFALLKEIPNSLIHSKHEYSENLMKIKNIRKNFSLMEQNITGHNESDKNDDDFNSGFQFLIYSNYNAMKTAVQLFINNKVGNIPQIKYIIKNIVKKKSYLNVKRYINEEGILYYDNISLDFNNIIQYLEEKKLSDNINVQLSQVDDFSYQQ